MDVADVDGGHLFSLDDPSPGYDTASVAAFTWALPNVG
jgi:hypothetical protein